MIITVNYNNHHDTDNNQKCINNDKNNDMSVNIYIDPEQPFDKYPVIGLKLSSLGKLNSRKGIPSKCSYPRLRNYSNLPSILGV